jgi:hypothetical protein
MHRGGLTLGAFLLAVTPSARALAHGLPPAASAVISHDAQGPRAVRLNAGLALRRGPQRYQFVCPAAWGDQFPAPLAALADGTIVLGSSRGLMLLHEDGTLEAHPDPAAAGRSSEIVHSQHGIFALRDALAGSEVLRIDAQSVRAVWKDSKTLYSLSAFDDKLLLLRGVAGTLEQVTLAAADGAELERQVAHLDMPVDFVFARGTAGAAYALVTFPSAFAVGALSMNVFTKLAEGLVSVAGPLRMGDRTLLGLDGQLSQLDQGAIRPLADDHYVLCLEQSDELWYACDRDGISRLSASALGEPLFRLSWLVPPDMQQLPEGELRMRCSAQWTDLRIDLLNAGTSLLVDALDAAPDAGSAPLEAPIAEAGVASQPSDAGIQAGDVDAHAPGAGPVSEPPRKGAGSGCSTLRANDDPCNASAYVFHLVFAFALAKYRRGRSSQGAGPARADPCAVVGGRSVGGKALARFGRKLTHRWTAHEDSRRICERRSNL